MINLRAGDIVKYRNNSRICNCLYGQVVKYDGESGTFKKNSLILLDNEGAPELWNLDEEDEKLLEVVGRIETDSQLLDIWWNSIDKK